MNFKKENPHLLKELTTIKIDLFLYNLTKDQLAKTLFPIGDLLKPELESLQKVWITKLSKPDIRVYVL